MDERNYVCLLAETLDKILTSHGEERDEVIAVAREIMERHRQMPQYQLVVPQVTLVDQVSIQA